MRGGGCGPSRPMQNVNVDGPASPRSSTTSVKEGSGVPLKSGRISKMYDIDKKELGSGSFAVVKKCTKKSDGSVYAVKIIDKSKVEVLSDLQREVGVMSEIIHPNIVRLYAVYNDAKRMHLVLELLEGGELLDRIIKQRTYTEKSAAITVVAVCDGLAYMHERNIVHRDLKPENLVYSTSAANSDIKITDFGFARTANGGEIMSTACGTPGYVAPEVLSYEGYSSGAVDMWSMGVLLYVLLCGFPPFHHDELPKLYRQIMKARYDFPSPFWDKVSPEAKDCVRAMLTLDSSKRIKADEVKSHKWVKTVTGAADDAVKPLVISESLNKYQSERISQRNLHTEDHRRGSMVAMLGVAPGAAPDADTALSDVQVDVKAGEATDDAPRVSSAGEAALYNAAPAKAM